MTDRFRVRWPDAAAFVGRPAGDPIRILAVSDEPDPSLDSAATREGIGHVDLVVGAGDLEPDYLGFVADAFHAPLRYVRGNHDVGPAWAHTERKLLPEPMRDGKVVLMSATSSPPCSSASTFHGWVSFAHTRGQRTWTAVSRVQRGSK